MPKKNKKKGDKKAKDKEEDEKEVEKKPFEAPDSTTKELELRREWVAIIYVLFMLCVQSVAESGFFVGPHGIPTSPISVSVN